MTEQQLHDLVADAIRAAAASNAHCSVVPGPIVAGVYADAAIRVIKQATQSVEPWHGQTIGEYK